MWKSPIQHQRVVFCAHTDWETRLKSHEQRICLFLLLYRHTQNYVKIPILESILEITVSYVLRESNQLRQKLDVHHYIGCIVSYSDRA